MTEPFLCRSCGSSDTAVILSLGHTPLANALLRADQLDLAEPTYPLELAFCHQCALVQITATVPPEELFSEYVYFSSFSETVLNHAHELAGRMISGRELDKQSLVLEVASNDGYLLQYYKEQCVRVLGIEPARNIALVAQERGINTLCEFFGLELAQRLRDEHKQADVIHAHNVLAHVADLNGFVAGMALLLKPDGVAVIEAPYVKDLIDHVEFDTIYHEHLCYFSLTALVRLFRRYKLNVVRVERLAMHGGSLRLFVAAENAPGWCADDKETVRQLLAEEAAWQVDQADYYRGFAARVEHLREQLVSLLADLKAGGNSIAAYGASAKGATLLNYCRIDGETLDFVVDRSTVKQGRFTPGTHLPIYSPERLLAAMPDFVLLLTWNFAAEILVQQEAYRQRGGRFIVPVPEPTIIGPNPEQRDDL